MSLVDVGPPPLEIGDIIVFLMCTEDRLRHMWWLGADAHLDDGIMHRIV